MKQLYLTIFCISLTVTQVSAAVERQLAIDVGSASTKLTVADVDTERNQIVQTVLDTSFPVPYQASLDKSLEDTFDQETKLNFGLFSSDSERFVPHLGERIETKLSYNS